MANLAFKLRKGFTSGVKDMVLKNGVIKCQHVNDIIQSSNLQSQFSEQFNEYGIVIIDLPRNYRSENDLWFEENMIELKNIFIEPSYHEKANQHDMIVINPLNPNSINVKNTETEHAAHTDSAHYKEAEVICSLGCYKAAINGGDSFFISATAMLDYVLPQLKDNEIDGLFNKEALTIGRQLPGVGYECVTNSKPILEWIDNNNGNYNGNSKLNNSNDSDSDDSYDDRRAKITYRHCDSYIKHVNDDVFHAWDLMTHYCDQFENRLTYKLENNQICVFDNTAVMHGRLPYTLDETNQNDNRILYRLNFMQKQTQLPNLNLKFGIPISQ